MIKKLFILSLLVSFYLWLACNKPSDFGAELDENDKIEVQQIDFPFNARTVTSDSIVTFDDSLSVRSYPFGSYDDLFFGNTFSELFLQFRLTSAPNDIEKTLDSVVLLIAYDTLRKGYGNYEAPMTIDVHRIVEDLSFSDTYFANNQFQVDPISIGSLDNFLHRPDTVVTVLEPTGSGTNIDTVSQEPHFRIRLDPEFGTEILSLDSATLSSNEAFLEVFKGLRISPASLSEGLLYLNLRNDLSGIKFYYRNNMDEPRVFTVSVTSFSVTSAHYEHDHNNSLAGSFLDQGMDNDSILFLQGMQGTDIQISFPDLSLLQDKAINNAELIFPLAEIDMNDTLSNPPITQLYLFEQQNGNNLISIRDLAITSSTNIRDIFGGNITRDSQGRLVYKLSMSAHLQELIEGKVAPTMILRNINKTGDASRSILNGSSHSHYPAKLIVTFTDYLK